MARGDRQRSAALWGALQPPRCQLNREQRAVGALTAATLGAVLAVDARRRPTRSSGSDEEEGAASEVVATPYGEWTAVAKQRRARLSGKAERQSNQRSSESAKLQAKHVQRRRRVKLAPMRVEMPKMPMEWGGREGGDNRSGVEDAVGSRGRLESELQWIHRHLPVLKLASTKNSRALRLQLLAGAIVHVSTALALRASWKCWVELVAKLRRDERRRLRAARTVLEKLMNASQVLMSSTFTSWHSLLIQARREENLAAVITIQLWARRVAHEKQQMTKARTLAEALRIMTVRASTIQRAYRRYLRALRILESQRAATQIQRVLRRRARYRHQLAIHEAAICIQRAYRGYRTRRQRRRERLAQIAFERAQDLYARQIQRNWRQYYYWKCNELPARCILNLVDQVEFLHAIRSIQRNIRRYQWRVRVEKRKHKAANCIQRCWRNTGSRDRARKRRQAAILERSMAAHCLQRTFRRNREFRVYRAVMKSSTRPLYLRMLHMSDPLMRQRLSVPIARSAVLVIQTVWRRHRARVVAIERQHQLAAANLIAAFAWRVFQQHKWRQVVNEAKVFEQEARASKGVIRTVKRWVRRKRGKEQEKIKKQMNAIQQLASLMNAAVAIQRYHRRRRDPWHSVLVRVLYHERPKQLQSAVCIQRWWRHEKQRRISAVTRKLSLLEVMEQRRVAEQQDKAARCIQRAYRRLVDRRNGRVLLKRYRILLRQELKKLQQRAVIHSFLQEESHKRSTRRSKKIQKLEGTANIKPSQSSIVSNTSSKLGGFDPAMVIDDLPSQEGNGYERYWSDEYQRYYLFNPATGESSWI